MVMVRVGLGNECKSNVMSPKVIKTQLQCARDPPISFFCFSKKEDQSFSVLLTMRGITVSPQSILPFPSFYPR